MPQKGWPYGSALAADKSYVRYFSPSALTTGDGGSSEGCPRKYFYTYKMGLKEPTTAAQALGTELHAQNEQYLLTGDRSGLGSLALAGFGLLPKPRTVDPGILIEYDIGGGKLADVPLHAAGIPVVRND